MRMVPVNNVVGPSVLGTLVMRDVTLGHGILREAWLTEDLTQIVEGYVANTLKVWKLIFPNPFFQAFLHNSAPARRRPTIVICRFWLAEKLHSMSGDPQEYSFNKDQNNT